METNNLEKEILTIKERNQRVELDKKWETSFTRKLCICILTYIFVIMYSYLVKNYDNIYNFIATQEYLKAYKNGDINYLISLIDECEFEIEINPNGTLDLVDLQGAYLGGVESYEEFEDILSICDRLECTYFYDYFGIEV